MQAESAWRYINTKSPEQETLHQNPWHDPKAWTTYEKRSVDATALDVLRRLGLPSSLLSDMPEKTRNIIRHLGI